MEELHLSSEYLFLEELWTKPHRVKPQINVIIHLFIQYKMFFLLIFRMTLLSLNNSKMPTDLVFVTFSSHKNNNKNLF